MGLKTRVWKILGKFDRRLTLAEDTAARTEAAANQMLEIATDMRAEVRAATARLEAAVVEQGKTLSDSYATMADERERRAGLGRELLRESSRLDTIERRLGIQEEPNGAA